MVAVILAIIRYLDNPLPINEEISRHGYHTALEEVWPISLDQHTF